MTVQWENCSRMACWMMPSVLRGERRGEAQCVISAMNEILHATTAVSDYQFKTCITRGASLEMQFSNRTEIKCIMSDTVGHVCTLIVSSNTKATLSYLCTSVGSWYLSKTTQDYHKRHVCLFLFNKNSGLAGIKSAFFTDDPPFFAYMYCRSFYGVACIVLLISGNSHHCADTCTAY